MSVVADVLELHRRKTPLPEIAAACLTSFQRVEEIIKDARPGPRRSHPRRSPRRQSGPWLQMFPPLKSPTSLPAKFLSRSHGVSFGDQCVRYLPNLRRYARRLAPDRSTAEDLIQDTLVLALANQHRFTPGTNLSAWLITIMHNQRINGLRRAVREHERVDLSVNLSEVQNAVSGEQEINRQIQELRRAMEQLTDDKRRLLLLAYHEGLSYVEIADMLKVPIGTVRSRLARTRSLLCEIIADGSALRPDGAKLAGRKADSQLALREGRF